MRRAICLLLAVWLCLPSFVFAAEQNEVNPPDRVNRALLVGLGIKILLEGLGIL